MTSVSSTQSPGYIYILKNSKYIDTNIYKIGRTTNKNIRLRSYPKGSYFLEVAEGLQLIDGHIECKVCKTPLDIKLKYNHDI